MAVAIGGGVWLACLPWRRGCGHVVWPPCLPWRRVAALVAWRAGLLACWLAGLLACLPWREGGWVAAWWYGWKGGRWPCGMVGLPALEDGRWRPRWAAVAMVVWPPCLPWRPVVSEALEAVVNIDGK